MCGVAQQVGFEQDLGHGGGPIRGEARRAQQAVGEGEQVGGAMAHGGHEYTGAIPAASVVRTWGTLPDERRADYPCDALLTDPDDVLFRGVTVQAEPAVVFRWLCQLKVAPYSYDWIDNRGRRSPRTLTAGAEHLAVGQPVMTIFELAGFEAARHFTFVLADRTAARLFGEIAGTYAVTPSGASHSRLVVKLLLRHPTRWPGTWIRPFLPAGDLVMMRKQLLTLKRLAEGGGPPTR
jgi:hypothetical protein